MGVAYDVFGNGNRDDGEREGKKYLPEDNHAETSSTGKQAASLAWKVSFATYFRRQERGLGASGALSHFLG